MAIKFGVDEDRELVALVDTVEDFERAIQTLDCLIVAPHEIAAAYGFPGGPVAGSAERDHAWQDEEDRWTTLGTDRAQ